jgi:hypothetical protein
MINNYSYITVLRWLVSYMFWVLAAILREYNMIFVRNIYTTLDPF